MSLSRRALHRPVSTVAAVLAVVLLGSVSLSQLPVSLLPSVALPVLTIRTRFAGAAPSEISRFVAQPVEEAVASTPGLLELRTVCRNDEAVTTMKFAWGTDMRTTPLTVRERLDNARGRLPERAERPTLLASDPGERPIAVAALTGTVDLRSLARTARDVHARRLAQLDGVASVAVVGAPTDEIMVEVDANRLRLLGLTTDDVASALRAANVTAAGGTVRRGQFRFSLRVLSELQSLPDIEATPVGPATRHISVRDLATVRVGPAAPRTLIQLDGQPAIGLVVYRDAGANTVAVTRDMERVMKQLRAEFPASRLRVVAAQAGFISDALGNLTQEIVAGGVLSVLVILLFLRDWRGAIAIAVVVPLSVLVALVLLQLLGVSINILSLGGLALGVGLLVDGAIVVAEATGRNREAGMAAVDAAVAACEELQAPLVAGTLTTVLVFGPVIFLEGLAAALFRDLSWSVVTSLLASLLLALTLLPVMMVATGQKDAPRQPVRSSIARRLARVGQRLAAAYEHGMELSLRHPRAILGSGLAVVIATAILAGQLPREILPSVQERSIVVDLHLAEGTALEETTRQAGRVAAAARASGSDGVYTRIGAPSDEEIVAGAAAGGAATAQLIVPVPAGLGAAAFADRLRALVPDLAQGAMAVDLAGQSEFGGLIGRAGREVTVEIAAPSVSDAERFAVLVREHLRTLPGLQDVRDPYASTQVVYEAALERERLARYNIEPDEVAKALAGSLGGVTAGDLRETDRRTGIRVRFAGADDEDLANALAVPVRGVPLSQLVRVREVRDQVELVRVGQRPVLIVEAVAGAGGVGDAAARVREAVAALPRAPGIAWALGGADAERRRTTSQFGLIGVLSVALVYLVLAAEFGNFTTPLLIVLIVPLAGAGSVIALWVTGQGLNAVSLIGLVVMIGIADNDAVVKLEAIERLRAAGLPLEQAILRGGAQRLRAIAMTSITTIVGVLPMVLGWGSGGELYQPLAAAVIGGSVSALLVTFFLLPTAYAVVERWRERRQGT